MRLRLLDGTELASDPARCVEFALDQVRVEDGHLVLRITPADLVHLRIETDSVLREIRSEALRAEHAWRRALGEWHEEGRAAVEARAPDVALLARVLEALRREALVLV
ncbi:hypothetical protein [Streptomyces sp. NBC_01244]|uniref:hypothetical protein n=1 Tax=Streptomyces sp. NBC_01244 TaxID=2903797 RepID=UPI002E138D04|nr:hypothetical protein OG247_32190 [Streptomyces sp. NBC_01244]